MTDQTDEQTSTVAVTGGEDSGTTDPQSIEETTSKLDKMNAAFTIWPPTQRTRDAVIKRLIETLSVKSVLSDRYGTISAEEAAVVARRIEEEAFNSPPPPAVSANDDGIEILQSYSKEISRRMLEFVKARSAESAMDVAVKEEENDGAGGVTAVKEEENMSGEA